MSNQIIIHLFEVQQQIYEKIFSDKGEIINKKYGKIESRFIKKRNEKKSIICMKISNKIDFNWLGYKYPNIQDNNIEDIFSDLMESLQQSTNKKNIIIKFGDNYLKPFRKMINNLKTDIPFILFNLSENDVLENGFFEKFKSPQYVSYIKDKLDPNNPDLNLHKILSYIWNPFTNPHLLVPKSLPNPH